MKRLLLRAGKDPRTAVDPYESLDRDTFGGNSGNLMFAAGAHKLLSAPDQEVHVGGLGLNPRRAAEFSEEYDAIVLPMANAIRRSYKHQLGRLAELVENVTVPVVLLSIGVQSGADGTLDNLDPIEPEAKRFFAALLDHSSEITVRGERTADYVRGLGFSAVRVIGCPSLTYRGPELRVDGLGVAPAKIAYNVQTSKDLCADLVADLEARYDATYVAQDARDLELMLWGGPEHPYPGARDPRLPLHRNHRQFTEGRARFMVDASTWMDFLSGFDLAVGPRIHGSVAAILGGTPGLVLSHDSRTEELASYHGIPHLKPLETESADRLADLFDRVDYSEFNRGQAERCHRVTEFLHQNGLSTIFDAGNEDARERYETQVREAGLPGPVECAWTDMSATERQRLSWMRTRDRARTEQVDALSARVRVLRRKVETPPAPRRSAEPKGSSRPRSAGLRRRIRSLLRRR